MRVILGPILPELEQPSGRRPPGVKVRRGDVHHSAYRTHQSPMMRPNPGAESWGTGRRPVRSGPGPPARRAGSHPQAAIDGVSCLRTSPRLGPLCNTHVLVQHRFGGGARQSLCVTRQPAAGAHSASPDSSSYPRGYLSFGRALSHAIWEGPTVDPVIGNTVNREQGQRPLLRAPVLQDLRIRQKPEPTVAAERRHLDSRRALHGGRSPLQGQRPFCKCYALQGPRVRSTLQPVEVSRQPPRIAR